MPGIPRKTIIMAERRFPVRVRIGVPPGGFGRCLTEMTAWLDENCGSDGWSMTPSGMRGVLNDALSIYFLAATLASAFVARWCAGSRVEAKGGVFRLRGDEPAGPIAAGLHRTPYARARSPRFRGLFRSRPWDSRSSPTGALAASLVGKICQLVPVPRSARGRKRPLSRTRSNRRVRPELDLRRRKLGSAVSCAAKMMGTGARVMF